MHVYVIENTCNTAKSMRKVSIENLIGKIHVSLCHRLLLVRSSCIDPVTGTAHRLYIVHRLLLAHHAFSMGMHVFQWECRQSEGGTRKRSLLKELSAKSRRLSLLTLMERNQTLELTMV
jgi:hypothetical protein